MNRYQDIMGKVNYWLFIAIAFLLPFPQVFLRYACSAWMITWVLEGRWLHKDNLRFGKNSIPFLLFALWFVLDGISYFWSKDPSLVLIVMERHLGFIMMVPIALWGFNSHYNCKPIKRALVYGCLAACFTYVLLVFIESPKEFCLFVFQDHINLYKHRLYTCAVETMAILAALSRRDELVHKYGKKIGYSIIGIEVAVMTAFIIATESRISLFVLLAIAGVYTYQHIAKPYKKYAAITAVVLFLGVGSTILYFHPRMQLNSVEQLRLNQLDYTREPRLNIWQIALTTPKDYALTGLGCGQSTPYLVERYTNYGFDYFAYKEYGAHNQYLREWMELGVLGLLLFLAAWISLPFCVNNQSRRLCTYTLIVFGINMLTEDMLERFDGIALWCFLMALMILQNRYSNNHDTNSQPNL